VRAVHNLPSAFIATVRLFVLLELLRADKSRECVLVDESGLHNEPTCMIFLESTTQTTPSSRNMPPISSFVQKDLAISAVEKSETIFPSAPGVHADSTQS
jgi:hypothetical protein